MSHYPPGRFRELKRMLENLGFTKRETMGRGGHYYIYTHPYRRMMCTHDRPFIVVPRNVYKQFSLKVIKKLRLCYSFTEEEIKEACR